MKGYSYPGKSPVKGRRRREQLAKNRTAATDMMEEAFGENTWERSTDLMKTEGFTINATSIPDEDVLAKPGPPKRSPAKQDTASSIDWDAITESAVEAGVKGAVQLGVHALKPKPRRKHSGPDVSGFSQLKFGRR